MQHLSLPGGWRSTQVRYVAAFGVFMFAVGMLFGSRFSLPSFSAQRQPAVSTASSATSTPAMQPSPPVIAAVPSVPSPIEVSRPTPSDEAALGSYQPTAPIHAAFFYPWYPQAWTQQNLSPFTNFRPSLGLYSSTDDSVIDTQLSLATRAHLDALISSWWGQGDPTDRALQHLLERTARPDSPSPRLRWTIYYEPEGHGDPSVAQIVDDLHYLDNTAFRSPVYLRVDGKPVVFVYADSHDGPAMVARWAEAKRQFGSDLYVVLKVFPGFHSVPNQPDSWHQYAPAIAYDAHLPYSVSVSPGFWKAGESPRLARDPGQFEQNVRKMAGSGATWQLVVSWNEWGEGTAVEPSADFGETYVDALCHVLPGTFSCGGAGAVATASTPSLASGVTPTAVPTRPAVSTPAPTPTPPTPVASPTASQGGSVVVVAVGDIACGADSGKSRCQQMATSDLARSLNPAAVLVLGDTQYEKGQYDNFRKFFDPSWGRLKPLIHPAVGNHEYLTKGASGYFDYFDGVGSATGPAGDRDKGYYSFNVGSWHLIALNSNCSQVGGCGVGSPQETWLRADLAAHPSECSLMFMHHPLFSSDPREFELKQLQPLWQAFYDFGGELVLVGHSHHYERFAPQDPNGKADPSRGIREIVVGTGGRNVYGFGTIIRPNSEVRNGTTFGVLKLTLNTRSFDWQFVPIPGETFTDSGSQACH